MFCVHLVLILFAAELDESSVPHILKLLFPKLERQLMLAKSVQVIDALQEIKIHEEDVSFLHPQWLYILGEYLCSTVYTVHVG